MQSYFACHFLRILSIPIRISELKSNPKWDFNLYCLVPTQFNAVVGSANPTPKTGWTYKSMILLFPTLPRVLLYITSISFDLYFVSPCQVCRVRLDQVSHCHVSTKFLHAICGHFVEETHGRTECSFCRCECESELVRTFDLKITLADDSTKIFAWCTGQTAAELLQISPDEFCELPEVESELKILLSFKEKIYIILQNNQYRWK